MELLNSLIKLAIPVAGLLEEKEKNKYVDKYLELQKEIANEELKDNPDDGRISYLFGELVRLTDVLTNTAFSKKA